MLNPKESVLIVTIDEKEYLRLGLLLEQIFPEAHIQMISSVINPAPVARKDSFGRTDEYLFFCFIGSAVPQPLPLSEEWLGGVRTTCKNKLHWNSLMRTGTNSLRSDRPNLFYPIYVSEDGKRIVEIGESIGVDRPRSDVPSIKGCKTIWPIRTNGDEGNWQISQSSLKAAIEKGFVKLGRFTDRGMAISYLKSGEQKKVLAGEFPVVGFREDGSVLVDENDYEAKYVPGTQWRISSHDASRNGSNLLRSMMPDRKFPFPKSLYAVEDAIRFVVNDKPKSLIVDFFSGSGTTAHAVMRLNRQDGGRRKAICITNNEVGADEQKNFVKQGFRQGDSEWEKYGICEYITKPRIKAAITGKTPDGNPIEGSYKFVDEFPMADGFEENAIFFDLEYLEPTIVSADLAFDEIAPILWLAGGCTGPMLDYCDSYSIGASYAVLNDPSYMAEFVRKVEERNDIKVVYIVTDSPERYRSLCAKLPNREVKQLYESYLRSFEINAIG